MTSKRVYKFPIAILEDEVTLDMYEGTEILHVGVQFGRICFWGIADASKPNVKRKFRIYGTGHPMPNNNDKYLGTVFFEDGALVFHVFEVSSL